MSLKAFANILVGLSLWANSARSVPTARSLDVLDPYLFKPRISFDNDGTFKLTVFSDLHYGENPWDWWGTEHDANSTRLITNMLAAENPSYVVINGDLITGENTFKENSTDLVNEILGPINKARIPFSTTQGNHDNQVNITHLKEIQRELSISPLSYTRIAPPGVGGVGGPGNYWVPIYRKKYDFAPVLILWFFDSRGGFKTDNTPMPDWVDPSVAKWMEEEVAMMNLLWGPAERRSALAFVHIPPNAIQAVSETLNSTLNPGLNADELGQGSTQASGPGEQGNDSVFWDALNSHITNLHAVVSGHDHGNEWCAREPTKDVIFCFDKHSGYGGYDSPDWGRGVRTFIFSSTDPTHGVETYIKLEDGTVRDRVVLDKNYQ
ncbi:hypothetical protein HYDPIDRAFT_133633 [Hydnomerulius pinastri MD-312]|uniref:Calcineurin-like phosphoesterase domain-containing protein n=1 Tax=Hydnomerulius pinastri MD-312 TaxID=994086 RepID=A0A0C9WF05_9AGAM|nr:hypothetical protein HYDPIDRAFT_133633 [Hydnomerulius pinastri MD-312]